MSRPFDLRCLDNFWDAEVGAFNPAMSAFKAGNSMQMSAFTLCDALEQLFTEGSMAQPERYLSCQWAVGEWLTRSNVRYVTHRLDGDRHIVLLDHDRNT